MRLSEIEATVVYPDGREHGIPIIQIRADDGLTGWGEAQASRVPEAVCEVVSNWIGPALKNCVLPRRREEIESIWDSMHEAARREAECGGLADAALGAVDMALWDLAGKARNCAVHRMVEGAGVAEVEAFVSFSCAEALPETVQPLVDGGFRVFELRLDRSAEELIAAMDRLRRLVPRNARIAVNALWRLGVAANSGLARQIEKREPLWLANPLPPEDPLAYGRLAKTLGTPLALGEAYHMHFDLAAFFEEGAVGMLQPEIGRCGFTEALRMAELAQSRRIPVAVRAGQSLGPQLAAALQLAALAPGRRVEYRPAWLKTVNSVLAAPVQMRHGKYRVPEEPGLGIELEEPEVHLLETQMV